MTVRYCEKKNCNGQLRDMWINFGESLDPEIIGKAQRVHNEADLVLAMGSSLRVYPACDLPVQTVQNGGNLVIINLQKTPLDD